MSNSRLLKEMWPSRKEFQVVSDLWNKPHGARKMFSVLTIDNINPNIKTMEYVVRGPLYKRAAEIEKELQQGKKKPFKKVVLASYGDGQGMGQVPITYVRQILAGVTYTPLLDEPTLPEDVKERVKLLLGDCRGGSVGSYTDPGGIPIVRKHCADYIAKRDNFPSDWNDITLCGGASDGIKGILKLLISTENGKKSAILTPVPSYPLYSAVTTELGLGDVGYRLDENNKWNVSVAELKRSITQGRREYNVRGIVIINPGNPAGQVFSRQSIVDIIKFAYEENLYILADEVYQDNIYATDCKFHSVKKVMMELGAPFNKMQLASFMSTSKGYMGECGLRGGYVEVINMCPQVRAMYLKCVAASLCPTVLGQVITDCAVAPPKEGDPSYPLWKKERDVILNSLKERASMVEEAFNKIEGISCNPVQGAMYAFPKIALPEGAIRKAQKMGVAPDVYYVSQLLECTGIFMVPGSGFGVRERSCRLRTTILPPEEELTGMLRDFKTFHEQFLKEYS